MTSFHIIDVTRWVEIVLVQLSLLRNNFFLFLVAISSNSSLFEAKVFWEWRKIKIVLNYLLAKCSFVCAVKNAKCCRHVAHKEKLHSHGIDIANLEAFWVSSYFQEIGEKHFFIPNQETKLETKEKRKKQKQLFCIQQLEISFIFIFAKQMFCFYCNFLHFFWSQKI